MKSNNSAYDQETMRDMFDRFFTLWAEDNGRDTNVYDKDGHHWWTMWTPEEALDITYDLDKDGRSLTVHHIITDSNAKVWEESDKTVVPLTGELDDDEIDTGFTGEDSSIMTIESDFHEIGRLIRKEWDEMEDKDEDA